MADSQLWDGFQGGLVCPNLRLRACTAARKGKPLPIAPPQKEKWLFPLFRKEPSKKSNKKNAKIS